MHAPRPFSPNLLLSALAESDLALLRPHLTREPMPRERVLFSRDRPIEQVWFMEGGAASVVATAEDGRQTEVGMFGREGMSGFPLLLGSPTSPNDCFIQVGGGDGLRIDADRLLAAVRLSAGLQLVLLRYVHTLLVQTAASAVSNAHQRIEARLARWLLMCHDRTGGDEIALTHEVMATMIAAERSGVTVSLHIMEGAGAIRSQRGRVTVLDRAKLEELAGDCYGRPEAEYRRLIGPFPQPALG